MTSLHLRHIETFEIIPIGLAEFKLMWRQHIGTDGPEPSDSEKKSDLLTILLGNLRNELLWRATDPGLCIKFRDMIETQAARALFNWKRFPIHALGEAPPNEQGELVPASGSGSGYGAEEI